MMLFELLDSVNDSTVVDIYAECTGTKIASFDSPSEVDNYYMDDEVTDVFVSENRLCVEIAIEPDKDYEDDI